MCTNYYISSSSDNHHHAASKKLKSTFLIAFNLKLHVSLVPSTFVSGICVLSSHHVSLKAVDLPESETFPFVHLDHICVDRFV